MSSLHGFDLRMQVNGQPVELEVGYNELLIDVLRDRLGLTGTKRSCDMEVCGVCTVLVDGQMVSGCTTLAWEARGKNVETIEGLAEGDKLHPIQEAFVEHNGFQCGFCTPGMILSTKALLKEYPQPDKATIQWYLHGNICRCTGYKKIIDSVEAAAQAQAQTAGAD